LGFLDRPAPGDTKGGGARLLFLPIPPVLLLTATPLGGEKRMWPIDLFPSLAAQLGAVLLEAVEALIFWGVGLLAIDKSMFCFFPNMAVAAANWLSFLGLCLSGPMMVRDAHQIIILW
jgi:hypothetical protein